MSLMINFLLGAALTWAGLLVHSFALWERPTRGDAAFYARLSIVVGFMCAAVMALKDGAA